LLTDTPLFRFYCACTSGIMGFKSILRKLRRHGAQDPERSGEDVGSKDGTELDLPKQSEITEGSTADTSRLPAIAVAQDPTGPHGPEPAADPTEKQIARLPTSQRLWNTAYDSLESGDSAKLVRAYIKILRTVLATEAAADADASTEDPAERQRYMRKLVQDGQVKVAAAAKITRGLGDVAHFVLSAKVMIDLAIQNIPQAALPWAGVCVGLQVSARVDNSAAEGPFPLTSSRSS
jgi:hypothetical protein